MNINLPLGTGSPAFGETGARPSDLSQSEAPSNGQSTLKASDKEMIEEVLAMMPQTWLNPMLAAQVWNQMGTNLSLKPSTNTQEQPVGITESSIVLSMMLAFAQTHTNTPAIKSQETKPQDPNEKDPVTAALKQYIQNGKETELDPALLKTIQKSPLLLNSLKSVDPKLIAEAYQTALKTVLPNMLDKLVNVQQASLDQFAGNATTQGATKNAHPLAAQSKQNEASVSLAKFYLEEIKTNSSTLSQPLLTVAFAGVLGGSAVQVPILIDPKTGAAMIDPSKDSIMPAGQSVITDMINYLGSELTPKVRATLALNLTQLVSNVQLSGAYWSIPGALTLKNAGTIAEGSTGDKPPPSDAEVKSYALTITQFVERPQFETLIKGVILKNIPPHSISEDRVQMCAIGMKIQLLANALGALDKMMMQSVVIRGADIEDLLTKKFPLDEGDFRFALVKLINEQFAILQKKDPAFEAALKASLYASFDNNPNLKSLIEPATAFLEILDTQFLNRANLEQPS